MVVYQFPVSSLPSSGTVNFKNYFNKIFWNTFFLILKNYLCQPSYIRNVKNRNYFFANIICDRFLRPDIDSNAWPRFRMTPFRSIPCLFRELIRVCDFFSSLYTFIFLTFEIDEMSKCVLYRHFRKEKTISQAKCFLLLTSL